MRLNRELDSNNIDESNFCHTRMIIQGLRHSVESQSIEMMDMKIPPTRFNSILIWIQIEWMKVIRIWKNVIIQAFPHSVEYQAIEVMNMKMRQIRFESIWIVFLKPNAAKRAEPPGLATTPPFLYLLLPHLIAVLTFGLPLRALPSTPPGSRD
jgi:hypothetical protein